MTHTAFDMRIILKTRNILPALLRGKTVVRPVTKSDNGGGSPLSHLPRGNEGTNMGNVTHTAASSDGEMHLDMSEVQHV